jgi:hypothetical protein
VGYSSRLLCAAPTSTPVDVVQCSGLRGGWLGVTQRSIGGAAHWGCPGHGCRGHGCRPWDTGTGAGGAAVNVSLTTGGVGAGRVLGSWGLVGAGGWT